MLFIGGGGHSADLEVLKTKKKSCIKNDTLGITLQSFEKWRLTISAVRRLFYMQSDMLKENISITVKLVSQTEYNVKGEEDLRLGFLCALLFQLRSYISPNKYVNTVNVASGSHLLLPLCACCCLSEHKCTHELELQGYI